MGDRSRKVSTAKVKGRADVPKTRFARLDHDLLKSAAYSALSPASRSLLNEFAMMVTDKNNGQLWLSVDDAAARLGVSDTHAAMAALEQLQELGFIAMTRDAHFRVKAGGAARARCWRLTWLAIPGVRGPSFDYRQREPAVGSAMPADRMARKRMDRRQRALKAYGFALAECSLPVVESTTLAADVSVVGDSAVVESLTAFEKRDRNPPFSEVVDSTTHIAVTMGCGAAHGSADNTGLKHGWAVAGDFPPVRGFKPQWSLGPLSRAWADNAGGHQCELTGCDNPVIPKRAGLAFPKRFCSPACQKSAERRRAYDRKREALAA